MIAQLISPQTLAELAGILLQFVLVFAIIIVIKKIALRMIDKVMDNRLTNMLASSERMGGIQEKRLDTLQKLFKSIVSYALYFIGIITCLDILGVKVTAILAGAGIVSLAVAFGAQRIVQDLMSGLFILLENQYAVGEYVKIGSVVGKVEEIGMKTTKLSTYNGEIMVIPNGKVGELINYSRRAQRANVDVGIAYEEDIDQACAVLEGACAAINEQFSSVLDEADVYKRQIEDKMVLDVSESAMASTTRTIVKIGRASCRERV